MSRRIMRTFSESSFYSRPGSLLETLVIAIEPSSAPAMRMCLHGADHYCRKWVESEPDLDDLSRPFTPLPEDQKDQASLAWTNSRRIISTSTEFLEHVKSISLNWRLLPDLCEAQQGVRDLRKTCPLVVTAADPGPTAPGPDPDDQKNDWPDTKDFILEPGQALRVRRTLIGLVIALNHVWLVRRYIDDLQAKSACNRFPYQLERSPDFDDYLAFAACDSAVYRMCMLFEVVDAIKLPEPTIGDLTEHAKMRKRFDGFRHLWTHHWGRDMRYKVRDFFIGAEGFLKELEGELWGGLGFICDCYSRIVQAEIARLYAGGEELDPVSCDLSGETIRIEQISPKPKPTGTAGQ